MTISRQTSALTDEERQVISLKYQAQRFATFAPSFQQKHAKALLLKIHVITGWTIPEKEFMNILVDQFTKKLVESYGQLNTEEIEYAFRRHGTTVEDWGKSMNLNLVDKVLIPYLQHRADLSEVEEKITAKPEQKIYTEEEILNQKREETEACYQRYLSGNLNYFPKLLMHEILCIDGLISRETRVEDFFKSRAEKGIKNIYVKA